MSNALSQIAALEAKIAELRSSQSAELREKLKAARQIVADLEVQIAKITGNASTTSLKPVRRNRTSPEEVKGAIIKALASTETGLSQKEISEATGLNYQTVVIYLKKNPKDFKTTGKTRSKRFFLR